MNKEILVNIRRLNGYTQDRIAREISITPKSYNLKENKKRDFSVKEIKKLRKVLGLTLDEVDVIFLK